MGYVNNAIIDRCHSFDYEVPNLRSGLNWTYSLKVRRPDYPGCLDPGSENLTEDVDISFKMTGRLFDVPTFNTAADAIEYLYWLVKDCDFEVEPVLSQEQATEMVLRAPIDGSAGGVEFATVEIPFVWIDTGDYNPRNRRFIVSKERIIHDHYQDTRYRNMHNTYNKRRVYSRDDFSVAAAMLPDYSPAKQMLQDIAAHMRRSDEIVCDDDSVTINPD